MNPRTVHAFHTEALAHIVPSSTGAIRAPHRADSSVRNGDACFGQSSEATLSRSPEVPWLLRNLLVPPTFSLKRGDAPPQQASTWAKLALLW